jgi:nucleotide-binding universal stress UspA family protein
VLTVPPRVGEHAPGAAVRFQRIVCALDFSACSQRALDYAISLAKESNSVLTVVHVIEPLPQTPYPGQEAMLPFKVVQDFINAAQEQGQELLAKAVPDDARTNCRVETVQRIGKPYQEILSLAKTEAADLIVIGVHGRSAADLLFFGSTTQHVVRAAACPVLTIRT